MPIRPSTAARASTGALRAVDTDGETASIEPFDEVSERPVTNPVHCTPALSGVQAVTGGSGGERRAEEDRADFDANIDGGRAAFDDASDDADDRANEPLSPDDPLAPLPFNPYKGNRGLTRAWHAMKNSLAGFRVAIREESAFRQELTLAAILIPCGVLVPVEPVSRVLLLGSVLLVLIVELLNSSVEAAIDRISLERHELSRRAKDLGSAAVMVALGMCLMTWVLIVGPLAVRWVKALL
jgi:diacylglycerol kinase (ATP)